MKFNWKNKTFIGGFITVLLLGFGIANPVIPPLATQAVCSLVKCDA